MSNGRAHIKAIAMANWRGIPFQIIEMDPYLTALEGRNGAGKTTVMSAFYLAIMPDVSLVKILNVGDTEDSGRESGLHGKLGATGECYTILELHNPKGERIVAGVQLLPKTAPVVEIGIMFIIKKLPVQVPIEKILTVEQNELLLISDISTIQNQVGIYGGSIEIFKSASKYGDELFNQGILPVKLSDKKDRRNFNKLLQTSFQGGFSQHLQERLKEYLLGEDSKIGDSIDRMQDNLKHCQKTNKLLEGLKEKIKSIQTVQSLGMEMLEGAIAGVKLQYIEREQAFCAFLKERREAKEGLARSLQAQLALHADLKKTKESVLTRQKSFDDAKEYLEKARKAHDLAKKLSLLQSELIPLTNKLKSAEQAKTEAQNEYDSATTRLRNLQEQYTDICGRVANAAKAWEQISREAGLYTMACECLVNAQSSLPDAKVSTENANLILSECKEKSKQLGEDCGILERKFKLATQGREEFLAAHEILEQLVQNEVPEGDAFSKALLVDREYKSLEEFVASNTGIDERISEMQSKALVQESIRSETGKLKTFGIYVTSTDSFKEVHLRTAKELEDIEKSEKLAANAITDLEKNLIHISRDKELCESDCHKFDEALSLRDLLSKKYLCDFTNRSDVDDRIDQENNNHRELLNKQAKLNQELKNVGESIASLAQNRTSLDGRYEKLEKALNGKLVATFYEEIESEDAGEKEARLGPLVKAIMVEDVQAAIEKIDSLQDVPDEVWLVQKGPLDQELYRFKKLSSAIVAKMDNAWRVTQIPKFPTIGAKSRRKKMSSLREEQTNLRGDIEQCEKEIVNKGREIEALKILKSSFNVFEGENPKQRLLKLVADEGSALEKIEKEKEILKELKNSRTEWLPIKELLDKWISESYLLDALDYTEEANRLLAVREEVGRTKEKIENNRNLLTSLRDKTNNLKFPPISLAEAQRQEEELKTLMTDWKFWDYAKKCIEELIDKLDDFRYVERFKQRQSEVDPAESLRKEANEINVKLTDITIKQDDARSQLDLVSRKCSDAYGDFTQKNKQIEGCNNELNEIGVDGSINTFECATADFSVKESALEVATQETNDLETALDSVKTSIAELKRLKNERENKCRESYEPFLFSRQSFRHAKICANLDRTLSKLWNHPSDIQNKLRSPDEAFTQAVISRGKLHGHFIKGLKGVEEGFHGEELVTKIDSMPFTCSSGEEVRRIQDYLDIWTEIVSYISQILPRDIVSTDDPVEASQQMQERYDSLTETLKAQEEDFRSDSRDVSNSIRGRINEERRKVTKINNSLDGISFGNIASIKIEFNRDAGMMALLDAMQDQRSLFTEEIPLKDAMKKVYEKITGGQTKGDDLLDYRKYISLNIKILRKSTQKWESGSGLSTGEAIGTGATILMVILDSWEDTASFIRARDLSNSMRFLFMDEATRLDPESIRTLLEFCTQMDIQLLIAGPKFEEEECGGGITYRLARKNFDGGEQVIIRGRKGFGGSFLEGATP